MKQLTQQQKQYINEHTLRLERLREQILGEQCQYAKVELTRSFVLEYIEEGLRWLRHNKLTYWDFQFVESAVCSADHVIGIYRRAKERLTTHSERKQDVLP